jgi:hypothetical protein
MGGLVRRVSAVIRVALSAHWTQGIGDSGAIVRIQSWAGAEKGNWRIEWGEILHFVILAGVACAKDALDWVRWGWVLLSDIS